MKALSDEIQIRKEAIRKNTALDRSKTLVEIQERTKELDNLNQKGSIQSEVLKRKIEIMHRDEEDLNWIIGIQLFGVAIGLTMAISGGHKWYVLVQKPMDERLKLELEELKSKASKQANP